MSLVNALLPHIRAALLAQIPPKHQLLLTELDRVSHEYLDHHSQLLSKFASIVSDMTESSGERLKLFDWERVGGGSSNSSISGNNTSSNNLATTTASSAAARTSAFACGPQCSNPASPSTCRTTEYTPVSAASAWPRTAPAFCSVRRELTYSRSRPSTVPTCAAVRLRLATHTGSFSIPPPTLASLSSSLWEPTRRCEYLT